MGLRGPRPKPKGKTISFAMGLPPPPAYLDDAGKREYKKTKQQLESAGVELQQPDGTIVAIYAQAVADIARLTEEIRKEGEVVEGRQAGMVKNPKLAVLEAARKTVIAAGAKLGFSPADRARVPAATKQAIQGNAFADL